MILRDPADPVIRSVPPDVPTGKKLVVVKAVEEAEGRLKKKTRRSLELSSRIVGGWRKSTWWYKENEQGRRDMVPDEL